MNTKAQDTIRSIPEFDNHEMVLVLTEKKAGLTAYVGIHSTTLGPALGGTRMQAYPTVEKGLIDALELSQAMSYKCALAKLPYGGGKGVIVFDPSSSANRDEILKAYARLVHNLGGLFKTGTDMGITEDDVRMMHKHTPHMLGMTEADRGNLSTSSSAALGVFYTIKTAAKVKFGSEDLSNLTIGIKGVGKLGGELVRLVHDDGAKVLIADTNKQACIDLDNKYKNVKVLDSSIIHASAMDIYAPCAIGHEFKEDMIDQLKCKIVAGGANNQLATPEAGDSLMEAGILYAPDYIANAGGLIYVADELEAGGFDKDRVVDRIKAIPETLMDIFLRSETQGLATHRVADQIAIERIGRAA